MTATKFGEYRKCNTAVHYSDYLDLEAVTFPFPFSFPGRSKQLAASLVLRTIDSFFEYGK